MSKNSEIVFMQVRLLRLASEEGDNAVFDEIKTLLRNKGVDVDAGII